MDRRSNQDGTSSGGGVAIRPIRLALSQSQSNCGRSAGSAAATPELGLRTRGQEEGPGVGCWGAHSGHASTTCCQVT